MTRFEDLYRKETLVRFLKVVSITKHMPSSKKSTPNSFTKFPFKKFAHQLLRHQPLANVSLLGGSTTLVFSSLPLACNFQTLQRRDKIPNMRLAGEKKKLKKKERKRELGWDLSRNEICRVALERR